MVSYTPFVVCLFSSWVLICFATECEVNEWRPWQACTGNCNFAMRVRNRDVTKPPFPELKPSGKLALEPCPALYQVQQCVVELCVTNDTSSSDNSTEGKANEGKILSVAEKASMERSQTVDGLSVQPMFHGNVLFTETELLQKIAADQLTTKPESITSTPQLTSLPSSTTIVVATSSTIAASVASVTYATPTVTDSPLSQKNVSFINVGPSSGQAPEHQSGPLISLPIIKDNQFDLNTAEIDLNAKLPSPGNFILFAGLPQLTSSQQPPLQSSSSAQPITSQSQIQASSSSQTEVTDNMPIPDTFPIGTAKVVDSQATKITDAQIAATNSTLLQPKVVRVPAATKVPLTTVDAQFFEDFDTTTVQSSTSLPTTTSNSNTSIASSITSTSIASTRAITTASTSSASTPSSTSTATTTSVTSTTNATVVSTSAAASIISSNQTVLLSQPSTGVNNTSPTPIPPTTNFVPTVIPVVLGAERPGESAVPSSGNTVIFGSPPGDKPQPRLHQNFINREMPQPLDPNSKPAPQQSLESNKPVSQPSLEQSKLGLVQPFEPIKPTLVQPVKPASQQTVEPLSQQTAKPPAGIPVEVAKLLPSGERPFAALFPPSATKQPIIDQQPILVAHGSCGSQNGNKRCCKLSHRNKCPDGKPAQMVLRWFRFSNQTECGAYNYGYCGYEIESQDNPIKFEEECYDYCYSDGERQTMPVFNNLHFHNGFRSLGVTAETQTQPQKRFQRRK